MKKKKTLEEEVIEYWNEHHFQYKIKMGEGKYTKKELEEIEEYINLLSKGPIYTIMKDGIYLGGERVFIPKYEGEFPFTFLREYKWKYIKK